MPYRRGVVKSPRPTRRDFSAISLGGNGSWPARTSAGRCAGRQRRVATTADAPVAAIQLRADCVQLRRGRAACCIQRTAGHGSIPSCTARVATRSDGRGWIGVRYATSSAGAGGFISGQERSSCDPRPHARTRCVPPGCYRSIYKPRGRGSSANFITCQYRWRCRRRPCGGRRRRTWQRRQNGGNSRNTAEEAARE